jgi:hypothetical protein
MPSPRAAAPATSTFIIERAAGWSYAAALLLGFMVPLPPGGAPSPPIGLRPRHKPEAWHPGPPGPVVDVNIPVAVAFFVEADAGHTVILFTKDVRHLS